MWGGGGRGQGGCVCSECAEAPVLDNYSYTEHSFKTEVAKGVGRDGGWGVGVGGGGV